MPQHVLTVIGVTQPFDNNLEKWSLDCDCSFKHQVILAKSFTAELQYVTCQEIERIKDATVQNKRVPFPFLKEHCVKYERSS